jgi:calcineurin-like phosphoesterase family protein
MKYLIIPDIHERIGMLGRALRFADKVEKVIFLGDWFDSFYAKMAEETAKWLSEHLDDDRYIFLMGNHDNHYCFNSSDFRCSGFKLDKSIVINSILTTIDWRKFKLFHHDGGWLFSHAGLHPKLWQQFGGSVAGLQHQADLALDHAFNGGSATGHPLWGVGFSRGGWTSFGGINWLDWNHEFQPIPELRQVVGHTQGLEPRSREGNWCIDTNSSHVAIVDTEANTMTIKEV